VANLQGMNAISALEKHSRTPAIRKASTGKVAPIYIGKKYRKLSTKLKFSSGNRHRTWLRNYFS